MTLVKVSRNLKTMSDDQLKSRLFTLSQSLFRAKAKGGKPVGNSKDTMYIRRCRKEKAMILTLLTERRNNRSRE